MYAQYFSSFSSKLALACTIDPTPPTFSGQSAVVALSSGGIQPSWGSASSTKNPVKFNLYIALGSVNAATLYQSSNLVFTAPALSTFFPIFTLADKTTYILNGQQYTTGVRAVDSQGYEDSNTVIAVTTAVASGNIGGLFQSLYTQYNSLYAQYNALYALFQADVTTMTAQNVIFTNNNSTMTTNLATLASDLVDFANENADFAASNATFAADLITLASNLASLAATDASLAATAALLQSLIGSLAGSLAPNKIKVSIKGTQKIGIGIEGD